ncbi:MAG: nuclear transport factor 2 family protein, partial [Candidatus Binatia bacterium]
MNADMKNDMSSQKKIATLWYEAFSKKDPALLDQILHETWVDIPAPPDTPPGPAGVKPVFERLTATFPDLHLTIKDILQDGKKVIVRAEMS